MKGQIKLEFIFAVVMFAMIIFWVVSQINTSYASVGSDSRNDMLRAKAYTLIAYLAEGSGDAGWESSQEPKSVGLAYENQPYNLSSYKISKLNCSLLNNYSLGAFRITIQDDDETLLSCGPIGVSLMTISITRNVYIEGEYGNITAEVW